MTLATEMNSDDYNACGDLVFRQKVQCKKIYIISLA